MAAFSTRAVEPTAATADSTNGVVEYFDIASKQPISCTPFTPRGRMVLNFKRIPHTTTWISLPDIAASHTANNIPPKLTNSWLNLYYTIPALRHRIPGQTDVALQDSLPVALYLEKAFPDSPSIFPEPGALAFAQLVDHTIETKVLPVALKLLVPKTPAILDERGAEYFRRTREEKFGPLELMCPDPEAEWTALEKELAIFSDLLNGPAAAPRKQQEVFLMGDKPSYADFLLVSFFQWFKTTGEKGWERAIGLGKDGVFRRLWDNCEQWLKTEA